MAKIRIKNFDDAWYEDIPNIGKFVFENGINTIRITELKRGSEGWIGNNYTTNATNQLRKTNTNNIRDFLLYQIGTQNAIDTTIKNLNKLKRNYESDYQ